MKELMKANEAPEKIYLQDSMSTDTIGELWPKWFDAEVSDDSIEYTRTDAFIEKASEYLEPIFTEYAGFYVGGKILQHFKEYMKGE